MLSLIQNPDVCRSALQSCSMPAAVKQLLLPTLAHPRNITFQVNMSHVCGHLQMTSAVSWPQQGTCLLFTAAVSHLLLLLLLQLLAGLARVHSPSSVN